jgi:peptidoglycan/LPS O-acetylase OafA/YrhL
MRKPDSEGPRITLAFLPLLLLAVLSYHFVERPMLPVKARMVPQVRVAIEICIERLSDLLRAISVAAP